jgi:glycerol-3-phosphate acyltransferase PlsY
MILGFTSVLIGYLLGSFPVAYIIAKLRKGVDIREVGVRNMGAGNVIREIGLWEGAVVSIVDIAKGSAAILVARALAVDQLWVLGAGFAAILGHNFPVYIGFRGGRGAATLIGVFLALAPLTTLYALLPIGVVLAITRNIFASIFLVCPLLPILLWFLEGSLLLVIYSVVLMLFVIFRSLHRFYELKNIRFRLMSWFAVKDRQKPDYGSLPSSSDIETDEIGK